MNLPAFVIVALVTWVLVVVGIQESAMVNTIAVVIKIAVGFFFIGYGLQFIHPGNCGFPSPLTVSPASWVVRRSSLFQLHRF